MRWTHTQHHNTFSARPRSETSVIQSLEIWQIQHWLYLTSAIIKLCTIRVRMAAWQQGRLVMAEGRQFWQTTAMLESHGWTLCITANTGHEGLQHMLRLLVTVSDLLSQGKQFLNDTQTHQCQRVSSCLTAHHYITGHFQRLWSYDLMALYKLDYYYYYYYLCHTCAKQNWLHE